MTRWDVVGHACPPFLLLEKFLWAAVIHTMNSIDTDTATAIIDIAHEARLAIRALGALSVARNGRFSAYAKALWRSHAVALRG